MRLRFIGGLIAIAFGTFAFSASEAEWERGISIEQALKAADTAAGFPNGRPSEYEVLIAKRILSRRFNARNEGVSVAKDLESLRSPKEFWLIVYGRWPPVLDGALIVFIDAQTGKVIRVYPTPVKK